MSNIGSNDINPPESKCKNIHSLSRRISCVGIAGQTIAAEWHDANMSTAPGIRIGGNRCAGSDPIVLDTGPGIAETYDCVPTVLPTGVMFQDGFE